MIGKNIKKHIRWKINDWASSIEDENLQKEIVDNVIVTGGAFISLLNNEPVNDYDIYFKSKVTALHVAQYYASKFNQKTKSGKLVEVKEEGSKIKCFIKSSGIAENENDIDDDSEPDQGSCEKEDKKSYDVRYITSNAITLTNKIQIIIRFQGDAQEIHENFDFVHCTCSYDFKTNHINLPAAALEAIITKNLIYVGSKYPLCSIIRTRKFIKRGWSINAGQYLKMALQLNQLELFDLNTLEDQLVGVDSAYFNIVIEAMKKYPEKLNNAYLFELINKIF